MRDKDDNVFILIDNPSSFYQNITMASFTERPIVPRRSFIFSPGSNPAMFPKALASGTDMVCMELEDGVAPEHKDEARKNVIQFFAEPQDDDGVERIVRINCLRSAFGLADVQAILNANSPPPGLMLPKVMTSDEVIWLDGLLTERGHNCQLHIIIETNAGLEAVYDIAKSSPRVQTLFFGGVDMSADLRCSNKWEPLLYARSRVIHAAATAGLDAIDVPFLDLQDHAELERSAIQARDLGFCGKGAIHPKQIPIINNVFTPDQDMIDKANRIIAAFEKAGTGLVVIDGKLIEKPVLREMQRIVKIHETHMHRNI